MMAIARSWLPVAQLKTRRRPRILKAIMSAEKNDSGAVEVVSGSVVDTTKKPPENSGAAQSDSLQKHDNTVKWWLLVLCVVCCTLL